MPASPAMEQSAGAADPSGPPTRVKLLTNAMTVDVEDYFQVSAFASHVDRSEWESFPSRVEPSTDKVLALLADQSVHATFFVLGWVAQRYPGLVRRIAAAGHEVASHGFAHIRVMEQAPDGFREDVRKTRLLLEDISGEPVRGYRAASFSIDRRTPWAFEILGEEGYAYSSSIYPIRHDLYGMPGASRFAHRPCQANGILEVPITTVSVLGQTLPCGGGGYFRLLPYGVSRFAMRRVNRIDAQPCVFYFHPWETDPGQPRLRGVPAKARFRHYTNLGRMEGRLRAVLADFTWDRMDRIFLPDASTTA